MTQARSEVLEVLARSAVPLAALGVAQQLKDSCNQATVYRALHHLESKGLVHSFVLHCEDHGTERYYSRVEAVHRHWFHCETCHTFIDLGGCRLHALEQDLEGEFGVEIKHHNLYFTGICGICRNLSVDTIGSVE